MKIKHFAIKKSAEEAKREAGRKGLLAKIFGGGWGKPLTVKTIFIENRLITFEVTTHPPFFEKLLKKESAPRKTKMEMIGNGSTCGVSYYDRRGVEITESDIDDANVQLSDFTDEALTTRANALARRILRRRVGGNISLEAIDMQSIFRPYHVVFFGEPKEGRKIYYIPIAADGCSVKRTF